MKDFIVGSIILIVLMVVGNTAFAKTPLEIKAMDRKTFSMVAIKEVKPEGDLGVIFICHKNEDTVRVIPLQPVAADNTVAVIWAIEFVSFKMDGSEKNILPFSTARDHIWNLGTAFNVMHSTEYKGTYAIRLYKEDGTYLQTRKFTDTEVRRIASDKNLKGCDNDHMQDWKEWEHFGRVDFNVYNKYN